MKVKLAILALLLAVGSAQAVEVGVNVSKDYGYSPSRSEEHTSELQSH